MNFYKHYLGDYARDTAHLSLMEHGAYRVLLDTYYATERPLPSDKAGLYRIAKAIDSAERKAVDAVVERFFPLAEDGLRHNKRADEEIEKKTEQASINKENGKLGGRPKKTEPDTDSDTERVSERITERDTETVSETKPNNNPNHSHSQRKEKTKASAFALPDWIPQEAWQGWLEVRAKAKAPNTNRALSLAVDSLQSLKEQGHDPKAVLENATLRGWRGLFPPAAKPAASDAFSGAL